jgi:hypothetical protein
MHSTVLVVIAMGILRRFLAFHVDGKVQEMRKLRQPRASATASDDEEALLHVAAARAPTHVPLTSKACLTVAAHILVGHALGFTIAYLNMLISMTYNVGLFVCIIVGETIGYMAFASGLWFNQVTAGAAKQCH